MKNKFPYCNVRFAFQTKCKISNFLHLKKKFHCSYVLALQLPSCNATYQGKTKRHFKVKMCKHLGISGLNGKRVKGDDDSAIKENFLFCNHTPDFENVSILSTKNNDFKVTSMESLLTNRDHPPLNKNKQSFLYLQNFLIARSQCRHKITLEINSFCCSSFILKIVLLSHEFIFS